MERLKKRKEILVLDKDNRILSVVDEITGYGNWDISITYDPYSVFNLAKAKKPDLIILDYFLLDDHCEEICSDFKDDAELSGVPIIIVSAFRTKKARADYYKCDALFIKPLDMEVLASRIDYLMAS